MTESLSRSPSIEAIRSLSRRQSRSLPRRSPSPVRSLPRTVRSWTRDLAESLPRLLRILPVSRMTEADASATIITITVSREVTSADRTVLSRAVSREAASAAALAAVR